LPLIQVPTLILHVRDNPFLPIAHGRYLAQHIPAATLVELPGELTALSGGKEAEPVVDEVAVFLTGEHPQVEVDRILTTIMFTDIVGSTPRAVVEGDQQWSALLEAHNRLVRSTLHRFRGREIDTAGDGFFATFDGPARAIRCALEIIDGVRTQGLQVRVGLHAGEVELAGDKVRGLAVHVGARIGAAANANEVLVSHTVKDLVAGSGIEFNDRGDYQLKGVPGTWKLFSVRS
jgi:class 3 adenylate cyclase